MPISYPHTIENCVGEKLTFKKLENDKLIVEAYCQPQSGPAMHTHFKQDEELTVVSGKMGYQIPGEAPKFLSKGESILFKRGTPHKFWAERDEALHCHGWVAPANSLAFFLSAVYAAQNKSGKGQPEAFDSAFLLTKYTSEYDMPEIPSFIKKVIFPATVLVGKLLGKYPHFKDAPPALK